MNTSTLLIVVVDDSAEDRAEVRRHLMSDPASRYRFIEADTGAEGLAAIARARGELACVLLDYQLPDMTAVDVLKALLTEEGSPACPVVVMTGADSDQTADDALGAGAQDYVGKRWMNAESLRRAVRNARARHSMALRLHDSEERLRLAVSAAETGIWDWDIASGAVKWSPECYAIHGVGTAGFDGTAEGFKRLVHPEDVDRVWTTVNRALTEHHPYSFEFRIVRPNGEVRWVTNRGRAFYDGSGHPSRMLGTITDITGRKQAEQQARRNAERVDLLARVGELLTLGTRSERETLETVFGIVAAAIGAEMYFNYEPHDEESMRLCAWGGLTADERTLFATMRYGELLCGRVAASRSPLIVEDIAHTDAPGSEAVRAAGYGAYAGFPLLAKDRLLGTIAFITRHKAHFLPNEIQTIRIVCDQVAATLERFRLDRMVRATEERQRLALEGAELGSWDVDLRTGKSVWNARHCELMGLDPGDGQESVDLWRERVHPEDLEQVTAQIEHAKSARTALAVAHRVLRPRQSETLWISLYGRFTYDDAGQPIRFAGVSQDITQAKRAQETLLESEQRLSVTLTAGKMGAWSWDVRANVSVWNAREYQLLGLPEGEGAVSTDTFFRHVYPDDEDSLHRSIAAISVARPDWQHEFRIVRADGQVRWLAGSGKMFFAADATPERMIGVNFDITDRKRVETQLRENIAELREAKAKLQQADSNKNHFLAVLAHELRNPLAPIRNVIELLQAQDAGSAISQPHSRLFAILDRQATHLVRLVDDLLDLSRIANGKLQLECTTIDIVDVVRAAVDASQPTIGALNHELRVELPDGPLLVDGDSVRLAQVFTNLLKNAATYTPAGGHIKIHAAPSGGDVIIHVTDDGIGLPPEMCEAIFEPFRQLPENAQIRHDGLGLGLALSRDIVQLHRGSIAAESAGPGQGTRVIVRIPGLRERSTSARAAEQALPSGSTRRILVVDDNVDAAQTLSMLLKQRGHAVDTANDGMSALGMALAQQPDVVLLDIELPDTDGYEVARRIRERCGEAAPTLIALTGYGFEGDRKKSLAAGFAAHLVKPADMTRLEGLIDSLPRG